ncbi:anaerobic ribonucleoside-triphosphate reductase activating protein [Myxococcota bacterium]|nr:anaerobic ribonucleoside-triphosphate reductase activating protein [Myxococcota bacterium]MBU1413651.1 anaerobic ribonucleoside-triphosphate reductase activating protein [Myxococcota bacterium]MBU1511732.1 anaerobic ribonucleoside-triphosphate reductase activating protein [Myxococcota bacterium]
MRIAGWHGTTLVDFPSRVASILFFAGCNLRCPFCHNPGLVLPDHFDPAASVDFDDILKKLSERRNFISGVVFTGGEPLMQADLPEAVAAVRGLGLDVKLDTNGTWPSRLADVLGQVQYVALDLKTSPARYPEATGGMADFSGVQATLDLLRAHQIPYELRTTVVPGLVTLEDIEALVPLVQDAPLFALQSFVSRETLDPSWSGLSAASPALVQEMAALLATSARKVIIRSN